MAFLKPFASIIFTKVSFGNMAADTSEGANANATARTWVVNIMLRRDRFSNDVGFYTKPVIYSLGDLEILLSGRTSRDQRDARREFLERRSAPADLYGTAFQ